MYFASVRFTDFPSRLNAMMNAFLCLADFTTCFGAKKLRLASVEFRHWDVPLLRYILRQCYCHSL